MKNFGEFIKKHGKPFDCRSADAAVLARYRKLVPAELSDHWREAGFCGYGDGLLWVTEPTELEAPLKDDDEMIDFEADPQPEAYDGATLSIFDFPSSARWDEAWVEKLAHSGDVSLRTFAAPAEYSKLQPLRQARVVVNAQFPDDVRRIEQLLQEAQARGAAVDWRATYSPRNE